MRKDPRPQPFIYSDGEVIQLLDAARTHRSIDRYALKPSTLHCLLGLLALTGCASARLSASSPKKSLEKAWSNQARTRNLRLMAIRSFLRFVALEAAEHSALIQWALAIPNKRCARPLVGFLTRPEIEALFDAVNRTIWIGRRDYALLLVAVQIGLRLPEITALRNQDVMLEAGAHVHCMGKGRKERGSPLTKAATKILASWVAVCAGKPSARFDDGESSVMGNRCAALSTLLMDISEIC